MGCIVSTNRVKLTLDNLSNLGKQGQEDVLELELERRKRVSNWVGALDRVPLGEHPVIVVEAMEGSDRSSANSHHSDQSVLTILDDDNAEQTRKPRPMPTRKPRPMPQEQTENQASTIQDLDPQSDGEASLGESEPDTSKALTKKEVHKHLDELRDFLAERRSQEREEGEAGDLETQFDKFDLNSDDIISRNEFVQICKKLGFPLDSTALAQIFYSIDQNGDGLLEKEEFILAFKPRPHPKSTELAKLDVDVVLATLKPRRPLSAKLINFKHEF